MIRPVIAILLRNLLKLKRDKMKLFFNLFMSGMLLFIFSFVIKNTMPGLHNPMNYLISGIIIMTVFQSSLNNSMNILEDISGGFMKEILVAPLARWQIAIGHVLSSMTISVIQGIIVVIAGVFLGLHIDLLHGVAMVLLMCLVGLTFSSLGLYLAALSKDSTNFQLFVMIVTFPLTFLSGAYIPTTVIPKLLMPLVYINPLTYATAAFRSVALNTNLLTPDQLVHEGIAFNIQGFIITPAWSIGMIMVICSLLFFLCVRRFNSTDFSKVKIYKHRR